LLIAIEFTRRTGNKHPNLRVSPRNYRGLLVALGLTADQIEGQLRELAGSMGSEGSGHHAVSGREQFAK
jgi:hypothetical protein